jgi:DNA-binding transcriptional MocR family regulator
MIHIVSLTRPPDGTILIADYLATERIPSYFELETQVFPEGGHVCRFDSVSKLLSAGIRLVRFAVLYLQELIRRVS